MEPDSSCNFLITDVTEASASEPLLSQQFKKLPNLFNTAVARVKYNLLRATASKKMAGAAAASTAAPLKPGDLVEVRSMREIALTLDKRGRHRGLYFMPEMEKFCGKKFKVFKKAEIIKLETTGELRRLKSPTLFLEGVHCNGEYQGGCDRACFHFWRDEWLKSVPD